MNKQLCIIACDHGLGHIRRCLLISQEWVSKGFDVTLYAPAKGFQRLCKSSPSLSNINLVDFSTNTSSTLFESDLYEIISWTRRLPSLENYDVVISDNLPEILSVRPDAIISSQFFWHEIVSRTNREYFRYSNSLLHEHEPVILGCKLFSMDYIKQHKNYIGKELYMLPDLVNAFKKSSKNHQKDLLLTGGSTPIVNKQLTVILNELLFDGPGEFNNVHVDPQILPKNPPKWMLEATFKNEMYIRIKTAYCRPGLGVVTDLLTVGAEIKPVYEESNAEMIFNAKVIAEIQSA